MSTLKSHYELAVDWADEAGTQQPIMGNDQALQMASVYAQLAMVEAISQLNASINELSGMLERRMDRVNEELVHIRGRLSLK